MCPIFILNWFWQWKASENPPKIKLYCPYQQNTSDNCLQTKPPVRESEGLSSLTQGSINLLLSHWIHRSVRWERMINSSWLSLNLVRGQHLNSDDCTRLFSPHRNKSWVYLLGIFIRMVNLYSVHQKRPPPHSHAVFRWGVVKKQKVWLSLKVSTCQECCNESA